MTGTFTVRTPRRARRHARERPNDVMYAPRVARARVTTRLETSRGVDSVVIFAVFVIVRAPSR
jgi:hypothetical protein